MGKFIDVEATAEKIYEKYGMHPAYYADYTNNNSSKRGQEARTDCIVLEMIYDESRMVYATETQKSSWIPCSERMPEKGIEVLVSTKGENLFLATWMGIDDWLTDDGFLFDSDVLAWQPVPEPYEGETDG